jgi:anti-anti-sigma factor
MSGAAILKCEGRIVRGEETRLLCAALRGRQEITVLDLSAVEAIDAAGVGVLVSLQAAGVYLTLVQPCEPVLQVLQLTGLDSVFEIRGSLDEALRPYMVKEGAAAPTILPALAG